MKDAQTDLSGQQAHIPVISPVLHCLALPAILCLRSSFGYLYLRPKSIFLALVFASTLLFIVAFNEPNIWSDYAWPVTFAFIVSWLYVVHLWIAFVAQVKENAEMDTYSGKSHLLRLCPRPDRSEMHLHLWIEPLLLFIAAAALKVTTSQSFFANWLALIALALFAKELRNYWSEIRKRKRQEDMRIETEETAENQTEKPPSEPLRGTRKPKQRHHRNTDS